MVFTPSPLQTLIRARTASSVAAKGVVAAEIRFAVNSGVNSLGAWVPTVASIAASCSMPNNRLTPVDVAQPVAATHPRSIQ